MKHRFVLLVIGFFTLLGIAAAVLSHGPAENYAIAHNKVQEIVMAERFIVVDPRGTPRAALGPDEDNSVVLRLLDGQAHSRIIMKVLESGLPSVVLKDEEEQERVRLSMDENGRVSLELKDIKGHRKATVSVTSQGSPSLTFVSNNGKAQAGIGVTSDEEAFITASTSEGPGVDLYLGTHVSHQNNGGLQITTSNGSSSMIVSGEGNSAFFQQKRAKGSVGIYTAIDGPVLSLFDDHGIPRANLDINQADVRLRFFGKDGNSRLGIGSMFNDSGAVVFHGDDQRLAGIIRANRQGQIVAHDIKGEEIPLAARDVRE